jgi:tripartite-type tricarboxylate transporter receptor subunit TctC
VQNMPGGGGLVAMNHLFNVAERDGTVVMSMLSPTVLASSGGSEISREISSAASLRDARASRALAN